MPKLPATTHRADLRTVLTHWGRIGCIGFGGPPAYIALLRKLCVDDRKWLDAQEFEDAIAACNLLPGPASTQLRPPSSPTDRDNYRRAVPIDWNAELLDQLDSHWHHQLRPRLDGLTDDEYFWQPVPHCWTLTRRTQSTAPMPLGAGEFTMDYAPPPHDREPVTTIAWRLAHLIAVFGPPEKPHFDHPTAGHHAIDYAGTAQAALHQLDQGHDAWVRDVRDLGTTGLTRPQGDLAPPQYANTPVAKLVMHIHREVIHHGAEICLLRDLYRGRDR